MGARMRVAVLGGGLMGCSVALALAAKGIRVVLFDRNAGLMTRAAVANEGKIHLGFMYAADPSLRTAKKMLDGALSFAPFFCRHLGIAKDHFPLSSPAAYGVHCNSQRSVEQVGAYLRGVQDLIEEHPGSSDGYFGLDLCRPVEQWPADRVSSVLNDRDILAAFDTPEVAIDPRRLADLVRGCIAGTPEIEVRTGHRITGVEGTDTPAVNYLQDGHEGRETFDHVVNALWDGRIAVDGARGNLPARPWIHRLKYGVDIRTAEGREPVQSITFVSGPFGEVVNYPDGSVYLTWYPSCIRSRTRAVEPPHWDIEPGETMRSDVIDGTYEALAKLVPSLRSIAPTDVSNAIVRGGPIVAWGKTDIDDPASELHKRYEIGVTTEGHYHSIDPGKLTAIPLFAQECADRISGGRDRSIHPSALAELDGQLPERNVPQ